MTGWRKRQVLDMAREAGGCDITSHGWTSWVGTQSTEFLERFAELVRADERERIKEENQRCYVERGQA